MQDKPLKTVLIVGCGYIGRRVAALLAAAGHDVSAVVRSRQSAKKLAESGAVAICADLDRLPTDVDWGFQAADIYYFAPPPVEGQQDLRMRAFLASLPASLSVR